MLVLRSVFLDGRQKEGCFLYPFDYLHNDIRKTLCIPEDVRQQFNYHSGVVTVEHVISEMTACKLEYILYSSPVEFE